MGLSDKKQRAQADAHQAAAYNEQVRLAAEQEARTKQFIADEDKNLADTKMFQQDIRGRLSKVSQGKDLTGIYGSSLWNPLNQATSQILKSSRVLNNFGTYDKDSNSAYSRRQQELTSRLMASGMGSTFMDAVGQAISGDQNALLELERGVLGYKGMAMGYGQQDYGNRVGVFGSSSQRRQDVLAEAQAKTAARNAVIGMGISATTGFLGGLGNLGFKPFGKPTTGGTT